MKKYRISLFLVLAMALSVFVSYDGEKAESKSLAEIDREIERLRQQMEEAKRKAADAEKQVASIRVQRQQTEDELNKLLQQINDVSMQITTKEMEIEETEENLARTEEELAAAIERIEQRDALLKQRLRLMYMKGNVSFLEVLMNSTSFSDFLDRYDAMKMLVAQDRRLLDANRRDKELIEKKKQDIETMLANLVKDYEKLEALKADLQRQKKESEVMIASLQMQEEHLHHISEEQERLLLQLAREENKKLQERKKAELSFKRGGKLGYPLETVGRVTSEFGYRTDPITGKKGAFHSGIDVAAPGGTAILAAESGLVIHAGWYGSYGNAVMINHGDGIWTLYAHARAIFVKKGDMVEKGQKIAEVGSTGRSTGNHLHFNVYLNEQVVNPRQYVNF